MGTSIKVFIFENDGNIKPITRKLYEPVWDGKEKLPDYAGQTARFAQAIIELENRKPAKLFEVHGLRLRFDDCGRIDEGWQLAHMSQAVELINQKFSTKPKIVGNVRDISEELAEKGLKHFQWKPNRSEINQIIEAIWPHQ